MNLFLLILPSSKLRASFIIHSFIKRSVGNGSPFTQLYSALNKINKTHLPTLSTKTIFFFYERKKISFKKTLSSTLLTFQRIYYKHLRSRRNNKVYIALRVAGGKLVYQEYTLYTAVLFLSLSRFTIPGCHSVD